MAGYRLTIRSGAKVTKESVDNLDAALAVLERNARELESSTSARPAGGTLLRRYEPVAQVAGRIELRGPRRLRGGVDLRGDGSVEAWTGRITKRLVEAEPGESAYASLGRVLAAHRGNAAR